MIFSSLLETDQEDKDGTLQELTPSPTASGPWCSEMLDRGVDGGWGWVVVAASFIAHLLIYGVSWTVGMFNLVFLEEFKANVTATSWIGSINTAALLGFGEYRQANV